MVDAHLIPNHSRFTDLSNRVFRRWTVIRFDGMHDNRACWWCRCECGVERSVLGKSLAKGISRSCGCLQRETVVAMNTTHNLTGTYFHIAWLAMMDRCHNLKCIGWPNYGGRGITVCKRWRESLAAFATDMGERPTANHTIERRDNSLGYSPENCVWATRTEQSRNKRTTVRITHQGKTQCLIEWADEVGLNYHTLYCRLFERGWTIDDALTTPKTSRWKHNRVK